MSAGIVRFGGIAMRVFTMLATHPLIRVLLMLATAFSLDSVLSPEESMLRLDKRSNHQQQRKLLQRH